MLPLTLHLLLKIFNLKLLLNKLVLEHLQPPLLKAAKQLRLSSRALVLKLNINLVLQLFNDLVLFGKLLVYVVYTYGYEKHFREYIMELQDKLDEEKNWKALIDEIETGICVINSKREVLFANNYLLKLF